ncbi:MAG TPA: hypothetical protein VIV55_09195 [Flavobacterium sp.]
MNEQENESELQMATPVVISPIPIDIDINDIQIDNKESVINAYLVVKKHPSVEMVEGLILVIDLDDFATPIPHVWNKIDDIHFDVTSEKKWPKNDEMNNAKSILYFSVKTHKKSDFDDDNIFEYCPATIENIAALNDALVNNQFNNN